MSLNLIDEFLNENWTNKYLKITILLGLGLFLNIMIFLLQVIW